MIRGKFTRFFLLSISTVSLAAISVSARAESKPNPAPTASSWGGQGMPAPVAKRKRKPKRKVVLPPELQEIEERYANAGTVEAQFEQVTESAHLKQKKKSSGLIQLKIPAKIRWETTAPDKSLLVSDGNRFWFYTPPFDEEEDGQLIERKGSDVRSKMATALMSASFSKAQKKHGLKIIRGGPSRFTLIPRKGSAGTVVEAKIELDPGEKIIRKIFLFHSDGNIAEITLTKVELGKPLEESLFTFSPPPHTQLVKE